MAPAGVITQIKKAAKSRFKYEVRRLKRRQLHIRRRKMAEAFASHNSRNFWSEVKKVNKKSKGQVCVSSIDGVSGDLSISNLWATKLRDLFSSQDVTERDNLHADVMNNISPSDLANLNVSPDSVLECIGHLKHG